MGLDDINAELMLARGKENAPPKEAKPHQTDLFIKHFGEVGQRHTIEGTVILYHEYTKFIAPGDSSETMPGYITVVALPTGEQVKYWGRLRKKDELGTRWYALEGCKVKFKATVVSHDVYKGYPQTVIQRPHVQELDFKFTKEETDYQTQYERFKTEDKEETEPEF